MDQAISLLLSLGRPGFCPRSDRVSFAARELAPATGFPPRTSGFPLSETFRACSRLLNYVLLLPEGQKAEA